MPIHEVYASLIKDFDTYWKKVVPMESFMFFTNDCCGKKIVDVIQPVQYSISSTVLFTSTFILNDFTKNPNTFDQIKKRNWQGSNYTAIDVISNKENAKNTIVVKAIVISPSFSTGGTNPRRLNFVATGVTCPVSFVLTSNGLEREKISLFQQSLN